MQFRVKDINVEDNSRVPDFLRTFPKVDLSEVVAEREWVFDHDMGLWTVNGKFMDPTATSAFPKQGTAEIWRYRRSEECRVGQECVSTSRSRGSKSATNNKEKNTKTYSTLNNTL